MVEHEPGFLRVGIIGEGKTDFLLLEAIVRALHPNIEVVPLFRDNTQPPSGWGGVRAWCRENHDQLELVMRGVVGRELDLLVIHVDCSMAYNVLDVPPCPPASATADRLRELMVSDWLALPERPAFLVLATPAQSSDAWVVATLDPAFANLDGIKCDPAAEDELIQRRICRRRDGEVKKPARVFAPLAARVVELLDHVCHHCTQAASFRSDFANAVGSVPTGRVEAGR